MLGLVTLCFVACGSPVVLEDSNGPVGVNVDGGDDDGGSTTGGTTNGTSTGGSTDGSTTGGQTTGGSTDGSTTGGTTSGNTTGGQTTGGSTTGGNTTGGTTGGSCDGGKPTCTPRQACDVCPGHTCQKVSDGCGGTIFCGNRDKCESCDRKHDRCISACEARGASCHPNCKKECDNDCDTCHHNSGN